MNKNVGEIEKFTFSEKEFKIREIIDLPNISMKWKRTSQICPHCKKKIETSVNHKIYKIEVLADKNIEDKDLKKEDIIMRGYTTDKRLMILPEDKILESLEVSKKFKFLKEK